MKKVICSLIILTVVGVAFYLAKKPNESPSIKFGAISNSSLTKGQDTDGNSTATTASITPSANQLILISVSARTNVTADTNEPTITGNGLTWVLVNSRIWDTTGASRKRVSVFRAMGSSPSTGAITIDYGGQNQTNIVWTVDQFSGVDTSGTNGSGAIVQSATNKDETVTTGTLTVTLGAFSSTNNATFGAFTSAGANTNVFTPGSGFSIMSMASTTSGGSEIEIATEYKSTNDTSVDSTWSINSELGGVAVEIKSAVSTPEITSDLILFE